jgi:hypothetical protein
VYKRTGKVNIEKIINQYFKSEKDFISYTECCDILKNFDINRFPIEQCYRIEFPIKFSIGRNIISSKLDRLDRNGNNYRIIEYKTGKPWKNLTLQDKLYSLGINKVFKDCKNIILSKYFIRYNKVISHIIDFSKLDLWINEIKIHIETLESDEIFKPKKNWYCDIGCFFKKNCGIY